MSLYLVGTPIGNLQDLTPRAVEVLKATPVITVEKWSDSVKLLKAYDITPEKTLNYDENNHHRVLPKILAALETGDVAYITSAGMPGVSDPGVRLVQACRQHGHEIIPIPGVSALTTAITASGIEGPYLFVGFAPRKDSHLLKLLSEVAEKEYSLVIYESTHRIDKTLASVAAHYPDSRIFVGKEMTKQFERYLVGTAQELVGMFSIDPKLKKGEFTLIIRP